MSVFKIQELLSISNFQSFLIQVGFGLSDAFLHLLKCSLPFFFRLFFTLFINVVEFHNFLQLL